MHGWSRLAAASASRRKRFRCASVAQGPKANHFERDGAIETFLMRAINYALTAPADFLQQLVVAEFGWNLCGVQRLLQKRRHRSVKKTQTAESLWRIREELAPAFATNAAHTGCCSRH